MSSPSAGKNPHLLPTRFMGVELYQVTRVEMEHRTRSSRPPNRGGAARGPARSGFLSDNVRQFIVGNLRELSRWHFGVESQIALY